MAETLGEDFYGRRVKVVRFEKQSYATLHELVFQEEYRSGQFGGEEEGYLSKSAEKALRGASAGDIVEIEFDYNRFPVTIVKARRVSGTPAEEARILTERVQKLESILLAIPNLVRAAADRIEGDRYEEARRVQHSVALGLETLFEKELSRD